MRETERIFQTSYSLLVNFRHSTVVRKFKLKFSILSWLRRISSVRFGGSKQTDLALMMMYSIHLRSYRLQTLNVNSRLISHSIHSSMIYSSDWIDTFRMHGNSKDGTKSSSTIYEYFIYIINESVNQ